MTYSGGSVVPDSLVADISRHWALDNPYRRLFRGPTWEERLTKAIKQRSIRYRWRGFRREWVDRLSLAYDALRGRHYCEDDD